MAGDLFENQKTIIAANIKWHRKRRKLKQREFSDFAQMNLRYYQDVEAAKKNLTIESIAKLCRAFDLAPQELWSLKRLFIDTNVATFIDDNRQMIESMDLPVGVRNHEREVMFHNGRFSDLLGQPGKSFVGRNITELVSKTSPVINDSLVEYEAQGNTTTHFSDVVTPDGIRQVRATPIVLLQGGQQVGCLTAFTRGNEADKELFHFYVRCMDLGHLTPIAKI